MSLFFGIFASVQGALIADYSSRVRDLEFSTNEHGFAALTCFVPLSLAESFMLYARPGLPHVVISDNGATVWEGRLEDVAIVNGGVRLGALGYWRAFSDAPYSAFWSKDTSADFTPITDSYGGATYRPEMYQMDNDNRVYISLAKSASYRNNLDVGAQMWKQSPSATRNSVPLLQPARQTPVDLQRRRNGIHEKIQRPRHQNDGVTCLPVLLDSFHGVGRDAGTQLLSTEFLAHRFDHLSRLPHQVEFSFPERLK